jgi:hypothetical protein
MSRRRNQLARSVEQAHIKITVERDGKSIKLVRNERRSRTAAKSLVTPRNAGERFFKRIANV